MQLQADAEAMEEEQSIMQTELLAEDPGIIFVDSDSDNDEPHNNDWGRGAGM